MNCFRSLGNISCFMRYIFWNFGADFTCLFKSGYCFLVWSSVFKFNSKGRKGWLMLCLYSRSVQFNVYKMSFSSCFFYSFYFWFSTFPLQHNQNLSPWNYIIKLIKLKLLITIFTPFCYNSYYAIIGNILFCVCYIDIHFFHNFSIWCI